jgi:hypothetical protein
LEQIREAMGRFGVGRGSEWVGEVVGDEVGEDEGDGRV